MGRQTERERERGGERKRAVGLWSIGLWGYVHATMPPCLYRASTSQLCKVQTGIRRTARSAPWSRVPAWHHGTFTPFSRSLLFGCYCALCSLLSLLCLLSLSLSYFLFSLLCRLGSETMLPGACAWSRAFAASSAAESTLPAELTEELRAPPASVTLKPFDSEVSEVRRRAATGGEAERPRPSEDLLLLHAHRLTDVADRVLSRDRARLNGKIGKSPRKRNIRAYLAPLDRNNTEKDLQTSLRMLRTSCNAPVRRHHRLQGIPHLSCGMGRGRERETETQRHARQV